MRETPKFTEGVLSSTVLNLPLHTIDSNFTELEATVNTFTQSQQNHVIKSVPVKVGTSINRIVTLKDNLWQVANLDLVNDPPSVYPYGFLGSISSGLLGDVYTSGIINPPATVEATISVGAPYFLAQNGYITNQQPERGIYVGTFINSNKFLLAIQLWINSHAHKRIKLTPGEWEDHTTYYRYILEQFPRPATSSVLVIDGLYTPEYGAYTVSENGIDIVDIVYFQTLFGTADVLTYLQSANIEFFYSDPRSVTLPGVMTASAGTPNIIIPEDSGNIQISCIPIVKTPYVAGQVVDNIVVDADGGLLLQKSPYVKSISAGPGISVTTVNNVSTVSTSAMSIYEEEMDDVFIIGAMSRVWPGTINTYMELSNLRTNSVTYRKVLPTGTNHIDIYAILFGASAGTVNLKLKRSTPLDISSSYSNFTSDVTFDRSYRLTTVLLHSLDISSEKLVYFNIGRDLDTSYADTVGILTVWIRGTKI